MILKPKPVFFSRKFFVHCNGSKIRLLRMRMFELLFVSSFSFFPLNGHYWWNGVFFIITGNALFLLQNKQASKQIINKVKKYIQLNIIVDSFRSSIHRYLNAGAWTLVAGLVTLRFLNTSLGKVLNCGQAKNRHLV